MMMAPITAVMALAMLLLAFFGAGHWTRQFVPRSVSSAEAVVIALLTGAGVVGLLLFLVGLYHFSLMTVVFVTGPLGVLGVVRAIPHLPDWRAVGGAIRGANGWDYATASVLSFLAVASLAPIAGDAGHDGIRYHLLGPAQWIENGRVAPVLHEALTAMPATIEMLFAAGMLLSNDRSAGIIGVAFAAGMVVLVAGLAHRWGSGRTGASVAAALASTMPVVVVHAGIAFVDVAFTALALATLRIGIDAEDFGSFGLAGMQIGIALGSKYTGMLLLAVSALTFFMLPKSGRVTTSVFQRVVGMCIVAVIVGSPWYIRNAVVLGSPVYPMPPGVDMFFSTPNMPPESVRAFQEYNVARGEGLGRGPLAFLRLPFDLTYRPAAFHGAGGIGLAPLALAPIGLIWLRRRRDLQLTALWCLGLTILWFVIQPEARYMGPVAACGAALAGVGAALVRARTRGLSRIPTVLVLVISVAYGAVYMAQEHASAFATVFSERAAEKRWKSKVPIHEALTFIHRTPEVRSVLIVDLIPVYFLEKPYVKIIGSFGERLDPEIGTLSEAMDRRDGFGATHLLKVRDRHLERVRANPRFVQIFESDEALVFRIEPAN